MRLTLTRNDFPEATIGILAVYGRPLCWILEDKGRPPGVKVPGETRIPAGIYPIRLYTAGRFHRTYAKRWDWHRGMLEIVGIPGFSCVLIHPGNTIRDTRGCLLPGLTAEIATPSVLSSRRAYERLYQTVIPHAERGELDIAIYDPPREVPGVERHRKELA